MGVKRKLDFNGDEQQGVVALFTLIESCLKHVSSPLNLCKKIDKFSCFGQGNAEFCDKEITKNALCFSIVYVIKSISLNPKAYDCSIRLEGNNLVVKESYSNECAIFYLDPELFVHKLLFNSNIRIEMVSCSDKEISVYLNDNKILTTGVIKPKLFSYRREKRIFKANIFALPYIYYFQLAFKAIDDECILNKLLKSYFLVLQKSNLNAGIDPRILNCVTDFICTTELGFEKIEQFSSLVSFMNWILKEISIIIKTPCCQGARQRLPWSTGINFDLLKSENDLKKLHSQSILNSIEESIRKINELDKKLLRQIYKCDDLYIVQQPDDESTWSVESDSKTLFSFKCR